MPLLSPDQRERFFSAVGYICQEKFRGEVLPGLLKGMAHYIEPERRFLVVQTVGMALHVGQGRYLPLLSDLAEQIEHLSVKCLDFLLSAIDHIQDVPERADAVSYLGPAAPGLSKGQRDGALTILVSCQDESQPIRVARFAAHMPDLDEAQCCRIVDIISGDTVAPEIRANALSYLGPVLKHFSDDQHRNLFRLANDLLDPLHRARAMAGLGAGGMASFDEAERAIILDAIAVQRAQPDDAARIRSCSTLDALNAASSMGEVANISDRLRRAHKRTRGNPQP